MARHHWRCARRCVLTTRDRQLSRVQGRARLAARQRGFGQRAVSRARQQGRHSVRRVRGRAARRARPLAHHRQGPGAALWHSPDRALYVLHCAAHRLQRGFSGLYWALSSFVFHSQCCPSVSRCVCAPSSEHSGSRNTSTEPPNFFSLCTRARKNTALKPSVIERQPPTNCQHKTSARLLSLQAFQ